MATINKISAVFYILIILLTVAIFGCAHKSLDSPQLDQPAIKYNFSKLNSGWGEIVLTLPEQVPPDTFWDPLTIAIVHQIAENIGIILDADDSANEYILFVDLRVPHIYALMKIDADYNISHWIYKNGVPVPRDPPEFFEHLGIQPEGYHQSLFKREV